MWWKKALAFLGGAAVGSLCTYNYICTLIMKGLMEERKPKTRKRAEYAKPFEGDTKN